MIAGASIGRCASGTPRSSGPKTCVAGSLIPATGQNSASQRSQPIPLERGAGHLVSRSLFLGLQMEIQTALSIVPMQIAPSRRPEPGQAHLGGALLHVPVEEATFAEQRAEDAGSTVRRADLPHDHGRCVLHPVDVTVGLPHRRAQTAAHVRRHIVELLWLPSAGSVPAGFDSSDCFKNTAHSSMGDLITIEAALAGGSALRANSYEAQIGCIDSSAASRIVTPSSSPGWRWPSRAKRVPIPWMRMHDQTEMERPDFSRNGDLQHRRKDQFRFRGRRGDHCFARRSNADGNFVATLTELNHQTLAEAVVADVKKRIRMVCSLYFRSSK